MKLDNSFLGAAGDWTAVESDGSTYYLDENGVAVGFTDVNGTYYDASNAAAPVKPATVSDTDWVKILSDVVPKVVASLNAWQLSQINIDRAKRNLPAINASAYGPQIGVGLTGGTSNMLLYGALAIGAIMLIKK